MQFSVEFTDTFAGQANYSWLRSDTITLPDDASDRQVVMAAKNAVGLTGYRCKRETLGETIILHPVGSLTICFIHPVY